MLINAAIIDDNRADAVQLEKLLTKWAGQKNSLKITYFSSPLEVLDANESKRFDYDLLFLDIMMPHMTGLELIRELQKNNPSLLFILTSSYSNYAETGYSVYAFDFISKPVPEDRLYSAMERVTYRLSTLHTDCFVCEADGQMIKIPFSDILMLKSTGNYLEVYLVSGEKKLARGTLKNVIKLCPDCFVKANRSTLVNVTYVSAFNRDTLCFSCSGLTVPLSKVAYDDVRAEFLRLN